MLFRPLDGHTFMPTPHLAAKIIKIIFSLLINDILTLFGEKMLFVTLKSNTIVAIVSHVDYYPNFESQFSSNPLVRRKERYTVSFTKDYVVVPNNSRVLCRQDFLVEGACYDSHFEMFGIICQAGASYREIMPYSYGGCDVVACGSEQAYGDEKHAIPVGEKGFVVFR